MKAYYARPAGAGLFFTICGFYLSCGHVEPSLHFTEVMIRSCQQFQAFYMNDSELTSVNDLDEFYFR